MMTKDSTDKPEHSPLPWRAHPVDDTMVIDATGGDVAMMSGAYSRQHGRMEADARLIVTAVNSHATLVALLEELIDIEGPCPGTYTWAEKVRAALSAAKGEKA